jgi:hypothetical protein
MKINPAEAVKDIIRRTKNEVKEEDRKRAIIQKFNEIFGFKPGLIIWTGGLTLEAIYNVKELKKLDDEEFDWFIEGKQVSEVSFKLYEEGKDNGYDADWHFVKTKGLAVNCYSWMRRYGQYTAIMEVITKNN